MAFRSMRVFVIQAQTTFATGSARNKFLLTLRSRLSARSPVRRGPLMLSRRAVLAGAAALGAPPILARAESSTGGAAPPTILRLERRNIEVNGKTASVYGISQPDGTFGLTTEVGKPFRVRVENGIGQPSLIHWHGLTPPWRQDGVPGISGPPIPEGGSADYDFSLRFGGTFWMHSHQGLQEQGLMTAPLIIHDERDRPDEQEVVVMLADFSFTPAEQIFKNLRNSGSMAGTAKPTGAMASTAGMRMAAPMSMGQSGADRSRRLPGRADPRGQLSRRRGDQFALERAETHVEGAHRRAVDDSQKHSAARLDLDDLGVGQGAEIG